MKRRAIQGRPRRRSRYGALGADLPSSTAARAVLDHEPGGVARLAAATSLRAGLIIAPALLVVGVPPKQALASACITSVYMTGLILLWYHTQPKR